jgi:hypothetical protein
VVDTKAVTIGFGSYVSLGCGCAVVDVQVSYCTLAQSIVSTVLHAFELGFTS